MNIEKTPKRQIRITKDAQGKNIANYLSNRFTYFNLAQWQTEILCGRVLLNNTQCSIDSTLQEKDSLVWQGEPYEEPEVPCTYSILFEDEDFLFIDKPAGLPCHPGGRYLFHTLWALLQKKHAHISFINRLDRETSGIVLVAKNTKAAAYANQHMSTRTIIKEYLVLVDGHFPQNLHAHGYLEKDTNSVIRKKLRFIPAISPIPAISELELKNTVPNKENPLSCQTDFELIQHCTHLNGIEREYSLVKAQLHTGRTHQIRASLCSLGWPVIGDKIYGQNEEFFLKFIEGSLTLSETNLLNLQYQALHCTRMSLPRPKKASTAGAERIEVTSPMPNSWDLRPAIDKAIIKL